METMAVHRCNKEDKIDSMEKSIRNLNRVVLEGTNGDSLVSMARHTKNSTKDIGSDVRQLLIFQTVVETDREIKQVIQEKKSRRQQWAIALLVGTVVALVGILVALVQ